MNVARLKRSDVELSYALVGYGPPVLLIQGVSVAGSAWLPQVRGLQDGWQLLTFDNRGLGGSRPCTGRISIETMAEDARALLDAVGWESAHVVGHSMGGVIAQQLALDAPQRVRSLSLLCTFARGKDAARVTPWVLWMTLRTRIGTRAMRRRAFLEMLWPRAELVGVDRDALARELAPLLGRDLADQPPVVMQQLCALAKSDLSSRLSELAGIPTWVLSAEEDRIAKTVYGEELAQRIPRARFEVMPRAAHGVPLHRVAEVNEKMREFMESVEARR